MKKLGFGMIGIILVAAIYYFTAGSAQITEEMKKHVDNELTTLEQNGFTVKERKIQESEEHFIISFDDTGKITNYLNKKASKVTKEDIARMRGLKVGVDITYLRDNYSAVSADIYPVALPESILQSTGAEDKANVEHIKKMMSEKKILVHLDFNKLLNSFKGYMKDINETFEDKVSVTVTMQGLTFKGNVENEKLKNIQQSLRLLSLNAEKEFSMKVSDLTSSYLLFGPSPYDTKSEYHIESLEMKEPSPSSLKLTGLQGKVANSVANDLLKSTLTTKVDKIKLTEGQETYELSDIRFNSNINNLDVTSLETLQKTDPQNEKAIMEISQKMISKGINMHISNFSVNKIEKNKVKMDGFRLNSSLQIDKSFDIHSASGNPLAMLPAFSGKSSIFISSELFTIITQDPRAMLLLMFFPPLEKEGKKNYEIKLEKGNLTVNGISL